MIARISPAAFYSGFGLSAAAIRVPKAPWSAAARRRLELMPWSSSSALSQSGVEPPQSKVSALTPQGDSGKNEVRRSRRRAEK